MLLVKLNPSAKVLTTSLATPIPIWYNAVDSLVFNSKAFICSLDNLSVASTIGAFISDAKLAAANASTNSDLSLCPSLATIT